MKKETYSFVLTPGIKKALEVASQKDRRSMSSYLEKIIIENLDKENISWTNGVSKEVPTKKKPKKG